ncbi:MAG: hypothetical protein MI743_12105, partial [Sneathiellales bacterium]|nr:hypothetical protein [Sneathiellales bacterium]
MKRQSLVWIFGFVGAFFFHAFGAIGWLVFDHEDRGASDYGVGGLKVSIFMQATATGSEATADGEAGDEVETKEKQLEEEPPKEQPEEKLAEEQPEPEPEPEP